MDLDTGSFVMNHSQSTPMAVQLISSDLQSMCSVGGGVASAPFVVTSTASPVTVASTCVVASSLSCHAANGLLNTLDNSSCSNISSNSSSSSSCRSYSPTKSIYLSNIMCSQQQQQQPQQQRQPGPAVIDINVNNVNNNNINDINSQCGLNTTTTNTTTATDTITNNTISNNGNNSTLPHDTGNLSNNSQNSTPAMSLAIETNDQAEYGLAPITSVSIITGDTVADENSLKSGQTNEFAWIKEKKTTRKQHQAIGEASFIIAAV